MRKDLFNHIHAKSPKTKTNPLNPRSIRYLSHTSLYQKPLIRDTSSTKFVQNHTHIKQTHGNPDPDLQNPHNRNAKNKTKPIQYLSSHKSTDMCHITEQQGTALICHRPEPRIIPVPRIRAPATNYQLRPEIHRLLLQLIIINIPSGRIHLVWQALKVDRSRRDLLPPGSVISMGKVAARWEVEAHDPIMGVQEGGVGGEIGWAAGVGLDIYTPRGGVKAKSLVMKKKNSISH